MLDRDTEHAVQLQPPVTPRYIYTNITPYHPLGPVSFLKCLEVMPVSPDNCQC